VIPEAERGAIAWAPEKFGASVKGAPLEVYLPEGSSCAGLIFAAIHGDEPDTTCVLSAALRSIAREQLRWAVVLCVNPDGVAQGTRANAHGVDLNRNFPASNWSPELRGYPWLPGSGRSVRLSSGPSAGSEPETRALLTLIERLSPKAIVAMHSDLACVDDPHASKLGQWLAQKSALPLVPDVGYPTPGSFGSWALEAKLPVITFELEPAGIHPLRAKYEPVFVELLQTA
jgi:protein MpaA